MTLLGMWYRLWDIIKRLEALIKELEEALETPEAREERLDWEQWMAEGRRKEQQKLKEMETARERRRATFVPEIIPARTCLSCRYRSDRTTYTDINHRRQNLSSNYIVCKFQNNGHRIWAKLH